MITSILINGFLFLSTAWIVVFSFRKDGIWSLSSGIGIFRYFTTLSNVLCAIAALVLAICMLAGHVPYGVLMFKYIGTAAVTITLLTVMAFLGPTQGYKMLLIKEGFFLHLLSPVLAIVSFCFLETEQPLSFAESLLGLLPMILYGILYLKKVVFSPEEKQWEDFYGFNKGGKWPFSFAAMVAGTFLICIILRLLANL